MVTRLIAKYGKLLIDILVIGLIIFAVVWINPFGMFGGNKLQLQDTANNISSIKEIGQLITAEYYGETIATYKQSKLNLIQEEDISEVGDDLFRDMKDYLLSKHIESEDGEQIDNKQEETKPKKEKQRRGFWSFLFGKKKGKKVFKKDITIGSPQNSGSEQNPIPEFLSQDIETTKEILAFYFKRREVSGDREIKNLLWKLSKEILKKKNKLNNEIAFSEYLDQGLPEVNGKLFSDFHYAKKEDSENFKKSTKLSLIGRGSVKAGIDFGELNDDNFIYDKDLAVVHIYGVRPKVLTKDINPWFIPEKKIPGFQILESRNANFEQATEVKKYCIDKLEKMALDAGLLQQAERQSKEAIKNFIGLLTNSEIKEVYFHNDSLTRFTDEIIKDQFISFEEARQLDTLIPKQIRKIVAQDTFTKNWLSHQKRAKIHKTRLKNVISQLKNSIYLRRGHMYNRLSYLKSDIIRDEVLTSREIQRISDEKWDVKSLLYDSVYKNPYLHLENRIWHGDSTLSFISHYNELLEELQNNENLKVVNTITDKTITRDSISIQKDSIYLALNANELKNNKDTLLIKKTKDSTKFEIATNTTNKKQRYFKKYPKEEFSIISITDNIFHIKQYTNVNTDLCSALDPLKYNIQLPENWKILFKSKKRYFNKDSLRNKNSNIVYSSPVLLNKIRGFNIGNDSLKITKIKALRDPENSEWKIKLEPYSISDIKNEKLTPNQIEEIIVLDHIAQYYLDKDKSYTWFTKASDKVKRNIEYKQLGQKMTKVKQWTDKHLVFW